MNFKSILMTVVLALGLALGARAAETDQLKADLIGQSMGGREACWKFQSADQIKGLTIKKKDEDQKKRVYTIALVLQAAKDKPRYAADAQVEYDRTGTAWKIHHVGLLSLRRMK